MEVERPHSATRMTPGERAKEKTGPVTVMLSTRTFMLRMTSMRPYTLPCMCVLHAHSTWMLKSVDVLQSGAWQEWDMPYADATVHKAAQVQ